LTFQKTTAVMVSKNPLHKGQGIRLRSTAWAHIHLNETLITFSD